MDRLTGIFPMVGTGCNSRGCRIYAPAKLNLLLELTGKRPDGYHDLESLMVMLELADLLEFYADKDASSDLPAGNIKLSCRFVNPASARPDLKQVLESESNLICKAARLLQEYTGTRHSARIVLQKRIPSEAGLGGGSSNAAAALLALHQLWNLQLPLHELHQLGAKLGSDVPFFLAKSPWAICKGRGELVEEIRPRGNLPVVVVKPDSGLSTKEVYQLSRIPAVKKNATALVKSFSKSNVSQWKEHVYNVLDQPARQLNGDLVQLRRLLDRESAVVSQMTGSGSACYVLCSHFLQANQLASKLRGLGYQQTWVTRTISHGLYCETI